MSEKQNKTKINKYNKKKKREIIINLQLVLKGVGGPTLFADVL